MEKETLDQLRLQYKAAVEAWVASIREEEALATEDHSIVAMEVWDKAGFHEEDLHAKADEAKAAYHDALREANYNF